MSFTSEIVGAVAADLPVGLRRAFLGTEEERQNRKARKSLGVIIRTILEAEATATEDDDTLGYALLRARKRSKFLRRFGEGEDPLADQAKIVSSAYRTLKRLFEQNIDLSDNHVATALRELDRED